MALPSSCPKCGSSLLQPERVRPSREAVVAVNLRCAECGTWREARLTRDELTELDRAHLEGRKELLRTYERCVAESMEALAHCLAIALAEDLVGADDFAPRRAALS